MKLLRGDVKQKRRIHAFTLVELSIVLVILGLLVGGVLTGQSLIRAAELRSITADMSKYHTAMMAFRDKYFAYPGDMNNATAFWGKDNTNCSGNTGTAATPGTCNGNGNGFIGDVGYAAPAETYRAWQQLSLAGLIEGTYTGMAAGSGPATVVGTNTPRSKISGVAFEIAYNQGNWNNPNVTGHRIYFGSVTSTSGSAWDSAITPSESWNIDQKIDDGIASRGKYTTGRAASYTASSVCTDAFTGTSFNYLLSDNTKSCHGNYWFSD